MNIGARLSAFKGSIHSQLAVSALFGVGGGYLEYKSRVAEGESVPKSAFNTLFWNVMPTILFQGPFAIPKQIAFGLIPAIPQIMQGIRNGLRYGPENYRKSAMPFSNYGFVPTAGAVQAMQRGLEAMGGSRGLSQAHAALAAQALRR
jgi:hypothetical protein